MSSDDGSIQGDAVALTERLLTKLAAGEAVYSVMQHAPTQTSEESARVRRTPLEQGAKALVFQADDAPLLLVVQAHRRIDTRAFKRLYGIKNLRMLPAEELRSRMGLEVGAVPPFGSLLNLLTYVDEGLVELPTIAFNAGSRSTSVLLRTTDFLRLEKPIVARFAAHDRQR